MGRREYYQEEKLKKVVNIFFITLLLSMVIFLTVFVMYSKKQKEDAKNNFESSLGMMEEIVSNDGFEETSYSKDLEIKEVDSPNKVVLGAISDKLPFTLKSDIESVSDISSTAELLFEGEFNSMMAMMIKSPISKFIETLASNLEKL